ncbi:MAG: S8 family peptidase [Myxococcales bacterium]|nr:S8 family peptidase [Myxococcales bacterium]
MWLSWVTVAFGNPVPSEHAERVSMRHVEGWPAFVQIDGDRDDALAQLASLGLVARSSEGSDLLTVRGSAQALSRARQLGLSVRLARRMDPEAAPPPTDVTGAQVGAHALWMPAGEADGFTGAGVTIANIDTSMDLFHPHFFRADGGVSSWVDVDGDGVLTPGVDGVDLDGDGQVADGEVARVLHASTLHYDADVEDWVVGGDGPGLDPARDWVWLDTNGDGRRNVGRDEGFTKQDPAFGEPLFVADDADGDGVVRSPEALVRLSSSVVAAVWTPEGVFRRGGNLLRYEPIPVLSDHATGVSGILVGGQLPLQRPSAGLAPDADLVLMDRMTATDADILEFLLWAEEEGVDVVLHEYAPWTGYALDGTSELEQLVTRQMTQGDVVHVCPAGNLADAGKHAVTQPRAGQVSYTITVPVWATVWQLLVDVHLPAGGPSECTVRLPDGSSGSPSFGGFTETFGSRSAWSWIALANERTALHQLWLWTPDYTSPLPAGDYDVSCRHDGPADTDVHAYHSDGYGWSRGAYFEQDVRANTMGVPSTADACLSVAAHGGRFGDYAGEVGEIRSWSSRGPTLDDRRTLDLSSPDDPFAPVSSLEDPSAYATYGRFGGTSGASPHVAAVAALLRQADPEATPLDIRDRILSGVQPSGVPEDAGGLGKLRGFEAHHAAPPSPAPPLTAVSLAPISAVHEGRCQVRLQGLSEVRGAEFRWDLDYDGTWDVERGDVAWVEPGEVHQLRVEAFADGWRVGGLAESVDLTSFCLGGVQERRAACGCASGASGAPTLFSWTLLWLIARRRR